jgi:hypothetical protein
MAASQYLSRLTTLATFVCVTAIGWPAAYLIRLLFEFDENLTEGLLNAGFTSVVVAAGSAAGRAWMKRDRQTPDQRVSAMVALILGSLFFGVLTVMALLTGHESEAVLFGPVGILVVALAIRELRAAPASAID